MRHDGRAQDELRPLDLLPGFVRTADGSVLFSIGQTRVVCLANSETSASVTLASPDCSPSIDM